MVACLRTFPGGSSPRMRGAHKIVAHYALRERIIPADAGSTTFEYIPSDQTRDHPRGCGEHVHFRVLVHHVEGSSPRMRGALKCILRYMHGLGIIPADAGSTTSPLSS